jgi:hypothetical protein
VSRWNSSPPLSRASRSAAPRGLRRRTAAAIAVSDLRLAISGDYDGFIKLLGAIETAAPPLVLSSELSRARSLNPRGGCRLPVEGSGGSSSSRIDLGALVRGSRSGQCGFRASARSGATRSARSSSVRSGRGINPIWQRPLGKASLRPRGKNAAEPVHARKVISTVRKRPTPFRLSGGHRGAGHKKARRKCPPRRGNR